MSVTEIFIVTCTIYNMSVRVVSADTNSSRRREFVYPIQHGREWVKNGLKNSSSYKLTGERILAVCVNQQNSVS